MRTVTLAEAQAHLPELVREAGAGEGIVITENDKAAARLASMPDEISPVKQGWPLIGFMKGGIEYRDGWEETPEGFAPYVD